jgi:hypothetical protein
MTESPQITFVCCVDSGWLEAQTLRMIESLRRWGGRFANAPIVAVTARFGFPLSQKTRQAFKKFDVEYIHFQAKNQYTWMPFLNKPNALLAVEKESTSEYIGWLDSDLLILGEPDQLILNEGEDFVACAADKNVGTSGPGDPFEPYWREICQTVGIDMEDLPWITTEMEGKPIRLYWNSGVFVYRRKTGFAKHYLQTTIELIDARLVPNTPGYFSIGINEQTALGLAMFKMGIPWRALPFSHNCTFNHQLHAEWYNEEQLREARILHYHNSMWPKFWPEFIRCLGDTHPDVADWVSSLGPMKNEAPLQWRATSRVLEHFRSQQDSAYRKLCRAV